MNYSYIFLICISQLKRRTPRVCGGFNICQLITKAILKGLRNLDLLKIFYHVLQNDFANTGFLCDKDFVAKLEENKLQMQ